jgi:hypothetical protein
MKKKGKKEGTKKRNDELSGATFSGPMELPRATSLN